MNKIILACIMFSLSGNLVFAYEPIELSDIIKQARENVKTAQLKAMDSDYLNKQNIYKESACEKINTKEIASKKSD